MSELASEMYPDYPDPTPEVHFLGGDAGRGLLASALAQPAQTFSGTYLNRTIPDKAAVLLISMIKNHPFVDGNKRIALTTTTVFLSLNGWLFYANRDDAVAECLRIAGATGNVDKGQVGLLDSQKGHSVEPLSLYVAARTRRMATYYRARL